MPVQRVVPDGHMEIVIHLGEPFSHSRGGSVERQAHIMISGQLTRAIFLTPSRSGRVFGIRFKPAGASAVLQLPMNELTEELRALDDVSQPLQHELLNAAERSTNSSFTASKTVRAIASALGAHAPASASSTQLDAAVATILGRHGTVSITALA